MIKYIQYTCKNKYDYKIYDFIYKIMIDDVKKEPKN